VIADLHCHYPMHVVMHEPRHRIEHLLRMRGRLRGDQIRVLVLRAASALFNDPHMWSAERVSVDYLRRGNARLVFSVLHSPSTNGTSRGGTARLRRTPTLRR
jgi:hypothetical protein